MQLNGKQQGDKGCSSSLFANFPTLHHKINVKSKKIQQHTSLIFAQNVDLEMGEMCKFLFENGT